MTNFLPWQHFFTNTSKSGVTGSILLSTLTYMGMESYTDSLQFLVCVMSFYVYLLQFPHYTTHSLSIKTKYPAVAQEFYTNSDNKNSVKFSVASDDHFTHLLTIRGNFVSLLRLCALQPGSGFDS